MVRKRGALWRLLWIYLDLLGMRSLTFSCIGTHQKRSISFSPGCNRLHFHTMFQIKNIIYICIFQRSYNFQVSNLLYRGLLAFHLVTDRNLVAHPRHEFGLSERQLQARSSWVKFGKFNASLRKTDRIMWKKPSTIWI